jgi:outer membrane beta-barrel protein
VKHGMLKKITLTATLFGLSFASLVKADEIPFDPNLPDSNPTTEVTEPAAPASPAPSGKVQKNGDEVSLPTPEELRTPPELEIPLTPIPKPSAPSGNAGTGQTKKLPPAELAGLGRLAPFDDIAVISKRYLPKTNRFEFFPNFGLVLNDSFFNDIIMGGRVSYYLTEQYGLEFTAFSVASSNKQVTNDLANRAVGTQALASPTSYYGLDFKWVPIYGKFGWLDKSVIPFDLYFVGGGGVTSTNQGTSPATLHLGLGQIFAIQKWLAFRWDISWYAYNTSTNVVNKPSGTYTNVHATIGLSFFFPGAGYR